MCEKDFLEKDQGPWLNVNSIAPKKKKKKYMNNNNKKEIKETKKKQFFITTFGIDLWLK